MLASPPVVFREIRRRKEHVDEKFYVAGGNIRWMFGYDYNYVEREIGNILEAINKRDILPGMTGGASSYVNYMLSWHEDNKYFIQSQCIARRLALSIDEEFISQAKTMSSNNHSWTEWIFQTEFFFQLRRAYMHGALKLSTPGSSSVMWNVPGIVTFRGPDLQRLNEQKNFPQESWLIPTKCNKACFDAFKLLGDSLLVVQVTRANKHKLNLEQVVAVRDQLQSIRQEELKVEIYVVVPNNQMGEFEMHKRAVRGKIPGWDVDQLKVAGL